MVKKPEETASTEENLDPIAISEEQFDRASHYVKGLKRGLVEFLKKPANIISSIPSGRGAVEEYITAGSKCQSGSRS